MIIVQFHFAVGVGYVRYAYLGAKKTFDWSKAIL